jgi:hypothetical protein
MLYCNALLASLKEDRERNVSYSLHRPCTSSISSSQLVPNLPQQTSWCTVYWFSVMQGLPKLSPTPSPTPSDLRSQLAALDSHALRAVCRHMQQAVMQ